jgi:squalene-hopene/tetraprenyl-beta-curcumene cyclase
VAKGIRWLVTKQTANGSWDEEAAGRNSEAIYTGTGFPRVFYLAYHLYRDYFPLLALTTYRRAMEKEAAAAA